MILIKKNEQTYDSDIENIARYGNDVYVIVDNEIYSFRKKSKIFSAAEKLSFCQRYKNVLLVIGESHYFIYDISDDVTAAGSHAMYDKIKWAIYYGIGDVNGDGHYEVIAAVGDNLMIYRAGKLLYRINFKQKHVTALLVDDIDNDNVSEMIVGIDDGRVYIIKGKAVIKRVKYEKPANIFFYDHITGYLGVIGDHFIKVYEGLLTKLSLDITMNERIVDIVIGDVDGDRIPDIFVLLGTGNVLFYRLFEKTPYASIKPEHHVEKIALLDSNLISIHDNSAVEYELKEEEEYSVSLRYINLPEVFAEVELVFTVRSNADTPWLSMYLLDSDTFDILSENPVKIENIEANKPYSVKYKIYIKSPEECAITCELTSVVGETFLEIGTLSPLLTTNTARKLLNATKDYTEIYLDNAAELLRTSPETLKELIKSFNSYGFTNMKFKTVEGKIVIIPEPPLLQIYEIKCPNCGSTEIELGEKYGICRYCGTKFMLR